MSVRGLIEHGEISGGPVVDGKHLTDGPETPRLNYDIDLTTLKGSLWGRTRVEPTDFPGGHWDCTIRGTFLPAMYDPVANHAGSINTIVGHGVGTLKGWKIRGTVVGLSADKAVVSGYVVKPADKP